MEDRPTNAAALASLGFGLCAWLCSFLSFCTAFVPLIGGMLSTMFWPLSWTLAFLGVVCGIVGYRTAMGADGVGRGSALAGMALSASWIIVQVLLVLMLLLSVGGLFGLIGLAAFLDAYG